jgi:transcriptional regulator with XRE-family HTH domain
MKPLSQYIAQASSSKLRSTLDSMVPMADKTPKQVLAERLASLMSKRGVNDEQVSLGTGRAVSPRTVGYMKQPGVGNPTLDNLTAVADYFGIAVWELLFDPEQDTKKILERGLKGRTFTDAARAKQQQREERDAEE